MVELFNTVLYEPLFNGLIFFYDVGGRDIGLAIIILTLLIKVILFYPSLSGIKSQKALQDLQPKIDAIRKKYKENREELGRQTMQVYKENKVSPFSSCLPLLIQLPILIALYQVFIGGLSTDPATGLLVSKQLEHLYGSLREVYSAMAINTVSAGFVDMAKGGNYILAALAGAFTYWQSRMMITRRAALKAPGAKDEDRMAQINRQMQYFLPVITVIFAFQFPAGLALYWIASTLATIAQQYYFFRIRKRQEGPSAPA